MFASNPLAPTRDAIETAPITTAFTRRVMMSAFQSFFVSSRGRCSRTTMRTSWFYSLPSTWSNFVSSLSHNLSIFSDSFKYISFSSIFLCHSKDYSSSVIGSSIRRYRPVLGNCPRSSCRVRAIVVECARGGLYASHPSCVSSHPTTTG